MRPRVASAPAVAAALAVAGAGCGGQAAPRAPTTAAAPAPARLTPSALPALSPPPRRRPTGRVVAVGAHADAIAADPGTHTFAVAVHDPSRLALVDSRSGRVRQRVAVPVGDHRPTDPPPTPAVFLVPAETGQRAVAVAPATRTAPGAGAQAAAVVFGQTFVTADAAVEVLDRGRPRARLPGLAAPAGLTAADFGTRLAVIDGQRRTVALYDPRTLRRVAEAPAGDGPTNVVAFGDRLYVADTRGNAVLVFTTRPRLRRVERIALPGTAPYGLALDPVRRRLHVTLTRRDELLTLPVDGTRTPARRLPTVRQPDAVAVDSSTGTIAVAGRADGVLQLVGAEPEGAVLPRHARPAH